MAHFQKAGCHLSSRERVTVYTLLGSAQTPHPAPYYFIIALGWANHRRRRKHPMADYRLYNLIVDPSSPCAAIRLQQPSMAVPASFLTEPPPFAILDQLLDFHLVTSSSNAPRRD